LDKNREDSGNAGGDYPAIQFNLEKTIAEKQPAVAVKQEIEQVPAAEVSVKTVESAAPVLSAETGGMTGDLLYMTSGSPVSETTQKRQVIEPVPAETSEMLKPRASEPVLQEAQYNESLQPIAAETQQTFTGPQAFSLGAVRVNDTEEAIAPMLSIRPTQPEIYYSYDFSEEEKSDLENNLFPDVIDGRNILTVNITKGELDVTKLEIVYVGGTSEARLFKKNVETGNWDEVRYAQKYYYDNALSYTKLDLEPLHFYVPFQYSDEYYYGD
jgi:hypothetical protein